MILGFESRNVEATKSESLESVNVALAGHARHSQPLDSGR